MTSRRSLLGGLFVPEKATGQPGAAYFSLLRCHIIVSLCHRPPPLAASESHNYPAEGISHSCPLRAFRLLVAIQAFIALSAFRHLFVRNNSECDVCAAAANQRLCGLLGSCRNLTTASRLHQSHQHRVAASGQSQRSSQPFPAAGSLVKKQKIKPSIFVQDKGCMVNAQSHGRVLQR